MRKSEMYSEVYRELERLRDSNAKKRDERVRQVYSQIPRIKEIDDLLYSQSINIARLALDGGDFKARTQEMQEMVQALNSEKAVLLKENGFAPNYLDDIYSCEKCKDTGFVKVDNIHENMCDCFRKRLIKKQYDMSNISRIIEVENFDTFDINIFSKDKIQGHKESPYENMQEILACVLESIDKINEAPLNMYFWGSAGMGKTFLCNCIAKELMNRDFSVVYSSAFNLFESLMKERFNKKNDYEDAPNNVLEMYLTADLLIVDDLGTESINSVTTTELFNILNTRFQQAKSTLISSNLSPKSLSDIYSERVSSRIMGEFRVFEFFGYDNRLF